MTLHIDVPIRHKILPGRHCYYVVHSFCFFRLYLMGGNELLSNLPLWSPSHIHPRSLSVNMRNDAETLKLDML